jgi:hypothetical protein
VGPIRARTRPPIQQTEEDNFPKQLDPELELETETELDLKPDPGTGNQSMG